MGRSLRRAAAMLFLASLSACAPSLKVMSFNVRYASDEGPTRWEARRPVMVALLQKARPDLIGTQELLQRQGDDLVQALPGYRWFGRDRYGTHVNEHMGILYRTDRLRVVQQGDFWLSDTPDQPGSMSWGTDLPRMANWAVFETIGGPPRRFLFVDTHLAHRDQDDAARDKAVRLILDRLPSLAAGLPVVLAGDMNARPDTAAYRTLASALSDAREQAPTRRGPDMTFHDFTGVADRRIDYLFLRGLHASEVVTDTYHQGSTYPSDHFPIWARLSFDRAPRDK
ncbi:Metal-dependent hydrolase, endonuclease/exonuclease/phosphatase family [Sphingomonas gellani]|uniref:Metal-dependent hydrolase, endonuclease/exonuclease/phosphatase family n=1 Tax=Sphingomonas gellani TaxID=1166340 RepID=A0A1H8GN94_9SPHN|nr:endonuclease/exonuclease/phosphatase family protein [Sphingomonas gellani]SEN45285.1 Metal-dependent hydrolase, endonuclease/exonuclease/phosphatase family [Sphingomonas gellani]